MECAQADKMDAGREPAKLWFHCLMAIVLAGQMVFLDSGDALRSSAAEVTRLRLKRFFSFFLLVIDVCSS